ncbi:MAG: DMT family transporter [Synechococcales cyanobacterium M58_A2018_015]|nr:DMT family transporter [Synechococcales cyanobacterium M58_A2018_015]
MLSDFRGEIAALSAALLWAMASFIYARVGQRLPALLLNLLKSSIAIGLIVLTLRLRGDSLPALESSSLVWLSLSGAIGIGLGDTAFLAALTYLGARRVLLLEALAPPLSALLAAGLLREQLSAQAWLGILLTVTGVAWVVVERVPADSASKFRPLRGIVFGIIAAAAQAIGAVLSRAALAETSVSPLWSSLIRLSAGVIVILIWSAPLFQLRQSLQPLRSWQLVATLIAASFIGTYLAIWLQQTALKHTATGIAQALTSTSPLFILPIAMATGERISLRAMLGACLALMGIWLLFS